MAVTTWDYCDEQLNGTLGSWLQFSRKCGLSHAKIAEMLTKLVGREVSKTTVGRWLAEEDKGGSNA